MPKTESFLAGVCFGLALVLLLTGCTSVTTSDTVTVDHPTVYVVAHPDISDALVCWLDEPLSRCAAARKEKAK